MKFKYMFEVGDSVKCISVGGNNGITKNTIYTINLVQPSSGKSYMVRIKNDDDKDARYWSHRFEPFKPVILPEELFEL